MKCILVALTTKVAFYNIFSSINNKSSIL